MRTVQRIVSARRAAIVSGIVLFVVSSVVVSAWWPASAAVRHNRAHRGWHAAVPSASPSSASAAPTTSPTGSAAASPTRVAVTPSQSNGTAAAVTVGLDGYQDQDLPRIAALGVRNIRMDHPTAAQIELARTYGIEVLPIADYGFLDLSGTSNWQSPPLAQNRAVWAKRGGLLADPRVLPTTHNYVEARKPLEVTPQPCSWDLDRFECAYNDFKAHGHPNPKVWITEFGWESNNPAPGYAKYGAVTEQQQAEYTVEALKIFQSSGKVAAAYSFLYKSHDDWNYNWLRPDESEKPVAKAVHDYLATR